MNAWLFILCLFLPNLTLANPFQRALEGRNEVLINYHKQNAPLEKDEIVRKIKSPFLKEEFEAALNIRSPEAPLAVFIPGTFGGYNSAEIIRLAQLLYQQGFNTLRFSNTISVHFVKHNPLYTGLDFETEAQIYVDAIRSLKKEYNFQKIHMIGASYGAFTGSVAAAKLGDDFNGNIILISPPKNILTSLKIIDSYFDQMKDQFDVFPWGQIRLGLKMFWAELWRRPLHADPEDARALLILTGFHGTFRDLLGRIENFKTGGRPWYTFYENWLPERRAEQARLRFMSYLKDYYPNFFKNEHKHEVLYWLNLSKRPWHIYTSEDDFINVPHSWPESPHITSYEVGGHIFGYMSRPDFLASFSENIKR